MMGSVLKGGVAAACLTLLCAGHAQAFDLNSMLAPVTQPAGIQQARASSDLEVPPAASGPTRMLVQDPTEERPGTVTIDTKNRFLYLSMENGQAMRYDIGVGRDGFAWSGQAYVARRAEWPSWTPPSDMLKRRPDIPHHMAGGIDNPLGARAMYLYNGKGDTMYRIHGTNEPDTIGQAVSSGCIRLLNADIVDLYDRVKLGAHVVVL